MTSVLNISNESRVNTYYGNSQQTSVVATLLDGSYVITWVSIGQDGSSYGVYMQRYSANGVPIGAETQVNVTTADSQLNAAIEAMPDGGFQIVWQSANQDGSAGGIYLNRYAADGTRTITERRINTVTANNQSVPDIAVLTNGWTVVTWSSFAQDGDQNGIFYAILNDAGTNITGDLQANTTTANAQSNPAVAALDNGRFVITWDSLGQDGSGFGVYKQVYNSSGVPVGSEIRVNATTVSDQNYPNVVGLVGGGYVVTWSDYFPDAESTDVYMQLYTANDVRIGSEIRVNTTANDVQTGGNITGLSDGGFVVVWQSYAQDGSAYGAYGQRYDAAGQKLGPEFLINTYTVESQTEPDVSALADGGFVVTWTSFSQDGSNNGVYQRRYEAASSLVGTQYLYGTIDADELNGGAGADKMYGGAGDDLYYVNSASDLVIEELDMGIDAVSASVSYVMPDNVELLQLTGLSRINGEGNGHNNLIYGNNALNFLYGRGGSDEIHGGDGNDNIYGGLSNDVLYGDAGSDWM